MLRSKDLTMIVNEKKIFNAYRWFSIPARMLRSKDTPDGCSPRMYQVSIQIRNLPIHNAPQK